MKINPFKVEEWMYCETGAFVTPGACFEEEHSMRIGYACDSGVLRDGFKAISQFISILEREELQYAKTE